MLGVQAMHDQGYMHRDISPKNLLILSLNPPKAAVCDYGKSTRDARSDQTTLGPLYLLAPEVANGNFYDKRIDIWNLGYAWVRSLAPGWTSAERVNKARHQILASQLQTFAAKHPAMSGIYIIMWRMITWDPDRRMGGREVISRLTQLIDTLEGKALDGDEHRNKRANTSTE